jgi:hypothetical protein
MEDYRNALSWLSLQREINTDRLGVWGQGGGTGRDRVVRRAPLARQARSDPASALSQILAKAGGWKWRGIAAPELNMNGESGALAALSTAGQLVAGPGTVPTPARWGVDALRPPAVRAVVIIAVVVKERAHHPEPVIVVMVKVVMGKALPVEFAAHVATTNRAHMAFGKTSTDATTAVCGKASAAKAAGMAATP